jgi:hypothetical protein
MNRWLQRLAELDGGGAPARTQDSVQIAQPPGSPAPPPPQAETAQANDHSERPAEISSVAASPAPASFFDHRCSACGQPARFGYEVRLLHGEEGRWFCAAHRPEAGRA